MELPVVVWYGAIIVKYNCTMACLLPKQNSSDSGSSNEIMHAVSDVKDNKVNDFCFDYSCSIFWQFVI